MRKKTLLNRARGGICILNNSSTLTGDLDSITQIELPFLSNAMLSALAPFSSLTSLKVTQGGSFSTKGLKKIPSLRHLELHCVKLPLRWTPFFPALESLLFHDCENLELDQLNHLKHVELVRVKLDAESILKLLSLPKLTSLSLLHCTIETLPPAFFAHPWHALTLINCDLSLSQLIQLKRCQNLKKLSLGKADDALLRALVHLKNLTYLHIEHCFDVTQKGLEILSQLKKLKHLHFGHSHHQLSLHTFSNLESLSFAPLQHTLSFLLNHPKLSFLKLNLLEIGVDEAKPLSSLIHLNHLDVSGCRWKNDFRWIRRLQDLKSLNFSNSTVLTSSIFSPLIELPKLESLNLARCSPVDDATLKLLGQILSLKHLNLSECVEITDKGISHLLQISSLILYKCHRLTEASMHFLKKNETLEYLDVRRCPQIGSEAVKLISQADVDYTP